MFSRRYFLPDENDMLKDITNKRREMKHRYFSSSKHTIQVDFLPYMDEIAELICCKPPIKKVSKI